MNSHKANDPPSPETKGLLMSSGALETASAARSPIPFPQTRSVA